jgi:predicted kinase
MPRLIHLNGPSGVGKSTLARRYADAHPGVLDLDTDLVLGLIGGWADDFGTALTAARRLATAMAETHLRAGHDVVMPQLTTAPAEVDCFADAATRAGATYREIALTIEPAAMLDRYAARATDTTSTHLRAIDTMINRDGGPTLLRRIHGHYTAYLDTRPDCTRIRTDQRTADDTYAALCAALGDPVEDAPRPQIPV